jgi:hypothetical protein
MFISGAVARVSLDNRHTVRIFGDVCRLFGSKAAMQFHSAKALLLCVSGFRLVCHYRVKLPEGHQPEICGCLSHVLQLYIQT